MKKLEFPCLNTKLVPIEKVKPNSYNPNSVASSEMKLLAHSIEEDGLTMPVVTCYNAEEDIYEIVDGEHRYTVVRDYFKSDVIAISVIDKPILHRMASTVRHNRARGVHMVQSEADNVKAMAKEGVSDLELSKDLGMSYEEIHKLKQTSRCAANLLGMNQYSKAYEKDEEDC